MGRFACSHCGHHFESEATEVVVCPNCYWSTSVKKDQDSPPFEKIPLSKTQTLEASPEPVRPWLWVGGGLFLLLLIGISVLAARHLKSQDEILHKIDKKNAQVIATTQPELALSSEEQEILARSVSVDPGGAPTEKESQILAIPPFFRSPSQGRIAAPPWDQKQFEEFLKGTQAQYRIPLEWSYRRKLTQLFQTHYLAAAQAFEAKDYRKARDEWIRSLTFPVYQNNLQRHRGVILTLLRPYINDVLSKIGAMNTALTGRGLGAQEEKIRSAYQGLQELLEKQSWEEANAKILEITKLLEGIEKGPRTVEPPPLPKETGLVDADIQEVLLAQAAPLQPGLPDAHSLRQDLIEKEKVIQSRLPEALEGIRKQYEEALALIKSGNGPEAKELLKKIEYPETLAQDARAKIKILDKLTSASLDSKKKSE